MSSNTPWVIIKYYNHFLGEVAPAYKIVTSPFNLSGKDISREKAMSLIEEYDMHLAFSSRDGRVWEFPDNPFYKKFANVFTAKKESAYEKKEGKDKSKRGRKETAKERQQKRKEVAKIKRRQEIEKRLNEMIWKLDKN